MIDFQFCSVSFFVPSLSYFLGTSILQQYTFPTEVSKCLFPKDGLGPIVLQRKELVKSILEKVAKDDDRAVYIRAPTGSGKTTLSRERAAIKK